MENKPKTILLVDDDFSLRKVMQETLEQEGYSVFAASDGQAALTILSTTDQKIDLIVLDLMMPVMSGWEFLKIQQNRHDLKQIPLVVVSGEPDLKNISAAAILGKPFHLSSFLAVIRRCCC